MIHYFLDVPIAGNIIGMLLIFLALFFKLIKLKDVKPASDFLVKYLVVFFIPYGVGLMVYANLIAEYWVQVTIAVLLSTLLSLYVTGAVYQKLDKK
ncbi:MAG: murein hydrolase transporter LrgA [Flavobacteriaceae bacterium]|nr:murein hydrolase transporter LrgA [Flavobacteriaceae bacterium]